VTPSFPLVAGAVSVQLPVQRTWGPAQALLMTPGGDWHLRTLPTGESVEWQIKFTGLTAAEAQTLKQFHQDVRGSYHCFRFCDPLRNLLAWSEDPTQGPWTRSGALSITLAPGSGAEAFQTAQILNLSGTEALVSQAVGCSPNFTYSMSVRAQSNSQSTIGLLIGGQRKNVTLSEQWQTYQFTAEPGGSMDQVSFAIAMPMGGAVGLGGVHAEFGACSPEYRKSEGMQGLFANARFKDDPLVVSCEKGGIFSTEATVVAKVGE
jgi:hypothetical protein